MNSIFLMMMLLLVFSQVSVAHDEHVADLKALPSPSGSSILRLGSVWKNQKGEDVNIGSLKGSPRLLVMLFTRCETACPLIVEDLKEIAKELEVAHARKMSVSIFSLDSFRETPESLTQFSVKRKLPPHWELYTSNADAVAELAAALGVRYKRLPSGDFIHSNVVYFLNNEGEISARKEGIKSPRADFMKQIKKAI